jgi:methylated-DNA-[protein]-cysteine S-methyltransferase
MPWSVLDSPIGPLTLVAGERGLRAIHFAGEEVALAPGDRDDGALAAALEQLDAYFAGRLRAFDLALDLRGTPFQRAVWAAVQSVPYGETTTYRAIAAALGGARGLSRAVGAGNACTPVPIVMPCHRVLGSDGRLTGYRGGLDAKRTLLGLERRYAASVVSAAGSGAAAADRSASISTMAPASRVRTRG